MQASSPFPSVVRASGGAAVRDETGLAQFDRIEAAVVDAVALAQAMHGGTHVQLAGFAERDALLPAWTHRGVAQVVAVDSPDEALQQLAADRRRGRSAVVLTCVFIAVAAFCAGALAVSWSRATAVQADQPALAWAPVDVTEAGLVLSTPAGRVVIPAGGKLPNGDVVLSLAPARRQVSLSSGTLLLQPAMGAAREVARTERTAP